MARCKYCKKSIHWEFVGGINRAGYKPFDTDGRRHRCKKPGPDSLAAYSHWNEDAERVYYAEHPEIFGRG